MEKEELEKLINKIIGCCIDVHKELGPGFEKDIYHRAIENRFNEQEISFESNKEISIYHHNRFVGTHKLDVLVEREVLLNIRAIQKIDKKDYAELRAYLNAADKSIGLLVNFAAFEIDVRRVEAKK